MQREQPGQNGGSPSMVRSVVAGTELDRLRATCRRQAHVIDTLSKVVATLRTGAAALKAENTDLRATQSRSHARAGARAGGRNDPGEMLDVALPLDMRAPGAARIVVAAFLRGHVPAPVLDDAQLVTSELVSNSVRHSGADATSVVLVEGRALQRHGPARRRRRGPQRRDRPASPGSAGWRWHGLEFGAKAERTLGTGAQRRERNPCLGAALLRRRDRAGLPNAVRPGGYRART